jgi:hypothetical protein
MRIGKEMKNKKQIRSSEELKKEIILKREKKEIKKKEVERKKDQRNKLTLSFLTSPHFLVQKSLKKIHDLSSQSFQLVAQGHPSICDIP